MDKHNTEREAMIAALRAIIKECGPLAGHDEDSSGTINTVARIARRTLAMLEAA